MTTHQVGCMEPSVWQTGMFCYIPVAAKTICFGVPPYFSPAYHWLSIYALPYWNGNTHLGKLTAQRQSKSASVHPGKLLFWIQSAIWAFANCFWHVCLMLRLHCEHKVLFGHLSSWFWCVSDIKGHLWALMSFHFVNWFWSVSAIKDHLCWVSVWDSVSGILL